MSTYWLELLGAQVRVLQGRYRTRIIEAGELSDPLLLLIHGTGGHAENYVRNIRRLAAAGHHVVALDLLWHGRSQTEGFDPELFPPLVDQLCDVMDQLGHASAAVEGQSLGGWVAMRFALAHPDRVRALILTTTQGFVPEPGAIAGYREPDWAANIASDLDMLHEPTFDKVRARMARIVADIDQMPDEAIEVRLAHYLQPALAAVQQLFVPEYLGGSTCRRHVVTEQLARTIAAPTLVYWGDRNRTPPALGEHLARTIPQGEFHCAVNTGHWAQFDSAPEHDRIVLDFLSRTTARTKEHIHA